MTMEFLTGITTPSRRTCFEYDIPMRESLSHKRYNTEFRYYLTMLRRTILFTLALPLLLAQAPKQRVSRAADFPVYGELQY